jgi:hypothetical protein
MPEIELPLTCPTCKFHTTIRIPGKKPVVVCLVDDRPKKYSHSCILHRMAADVDLLTEEKPNEA